MLQRRSQRMMTPRAAPKPNVCATQSATLLCTNGNQRLMPVSGGSARFSCDPNVPVHESLLRLSVCCGSLSARCVFRLVAGRFACVRASGRSACSSSSLTAIFVVLFFYLNFGTPFFPVLSRFSLLFKETKRTFIKRATGTRKEKDGIDPRKTVACRKVPERTGYVCPDSIPRHTIRFDCGLAQVNPVA